MASGASEGSSEPAASASRREAEAQRHTRYNFLVGRLRSRQITIEEATELFDLMQAMLRASEAARRATVIPPPSPRATPGLSRPETAPPAPSAAPDDLFLVGLLAMGAGAGLLAAMSRRLAEGPLPTNGRGSGPTERRAG
jgi:hypothetical protein